LPLKEDVRSDARSKTSSVENTESVLADENQTSLAVFVVDNHAGLADGVGFGSVAELVDGEAVVADNGANHCPDENERNEVSSLSKTFFLMRYQKKLVFFHQVISG
jgi:hypothetical protein